MKRKTIFVGDCPLHSSEANTLGSYVELNGEQFYRIRNYDHMDPFFMTVVSDSNHWMFVSSNGALTCGRRNPESALFPYSTDDRIHDSQDQTGPKSLLMISGSEGSYLWEPFSARYAGAYRTERNIYKNIPGNKLIFEEINHSLNLTFRYSWMSSDRFGFVRKAELTNDGDQALDINMIDGLQNLMPSNVDRDMQTVFSTLVDAYKKCELLSDSGIGIYALSSVPVDRAEPSESLTANTVWSAGLDNPAYLLSTRQLERFRQGDNVEPENKMRGVRGAYFIQSEFALRGGEKKQWLLVAEVDQTAADIAALQADRPSESLLSEDIEAGTKNLSEIVAQADGIQTGGDRLQTARHYANTLFNVMRGGIFENGYAVSKEDLLNFIHTANRRMAKKMEDIQLPVIFAYSDGLAAIRQLEDPVLERLYLEYMPLTFSRRHGDPSRPWNRFSIETRNPDGSKKLSYEGNWRDIFQNWEALGISYPAFFSSMISKFVNASTPDGYNPYRITRNGIDWEVLDLSDPWSYIGYWGDHQIIYLLKLMEQCEAYYPGNLRQLLSREIFVYADVPYHIKSYDALLTNPCDSIEFAEEAHETALARSEKVGSDGKLVHLKNNEIYRVNLAEKLLVPLLAKLSNFIPEAGIWLNTQRPEWNDANNALVGSGVSMVTLCYIRRYLNFCIGLFSESNRTSFALSAEVERLFGEMRDALETHQDLLASGFTNAQRRSVLDALGRSGEHYRKAIYTNGFTGTKTGLSTEKIVHFLEVALNYIDQTIATNRRPDGLYHAYNLMSVDREGGVAVRNLYEMLEGQVAILSSGKLSAEESIDVLKALRKSSLYRPDQHSYILYPNRPLPDFAQKNCIKKEELPAMDERFVSVDCNGVWHFNPQFRNAAMLKTLLRGTETSETDCERWLSLYEQVFDHQSFTGRSGTFFKYEGLGSIYWHMVSKLLLAVQEICISEKDSDLSGALNDCYYDIRRGIGAFKSVNEQGAFPTDPYSHTPAMMGAQQPGLTGQVKEDFISRLVELGIRVNNGSLTIDPFLSTEKDITFTFCTVPISIKEGSSNEIRVRFKDKSERMISGLALDEELSAEIFNRTGNIQQLYVTSEVAQNSVTSAGSKTAVAAEEPANAEV